MENYFDSCIEFSLGFAGSYITDTESLFKILLSIIVLSVIDFPSTVKAYLIINLFSSTSLRSKIFAVAVCLVLQDMNVENNRKTKIVRINFIR